MAELLSDEEFPKLVRYIREELGARDVAFRVGAERAARKEAEAKLAAVEAERDSLKTQHLLAEDEARRYRVLAAENGRIAVGGIAATKKATARAERAEAKLAAIDENNIAFMKARGLYIEDDPFPTWMQVGVSFDHERIRAEAAEAALAKARESTLRALEPFSKWFIVTGSSIDARWTRIPKEDRVEIVNNLRELHRTLALISAPEGKGEPG